MGPNQHLLNIALQEYGVQEIVGNKHNPRILEYFKASGHDWVKDDELAWCAAYANYCAVTAGLESTGKLNARSFLDVGEKIHWSQVMPGDVIIFWRIKKDSPYGHVAFFINWSIDQDLFVNVLGGNQGNKVQISPYYRSRILGIRRLRVKQKFY